jgi:hypothetical protein
MRKTEKARDLAGKVDGLLSGYFARLGELGFGAPATLHWRTVFVLVASGTIFHCQCFFMVLFFLFDELTPALIIFRHQRAPKFRFR